MREDRIREIVRNTHAALDDLGMSDLRGVGVRSAGIVAGHLREQSIEVTAREVSAALILILEDHANALGEEIRKARPN